MILPPTLRARPAVLVVAHPGHELRVHGWLEAARPEVWVLTNGAGHGERGRLDSTAAVLARSGAAVGPVFGLFTDQQAYSLLLDGAVSPIVAVTERLVARLAAEPGVYAVGDSMEGFNPIHDLCRVIIDTATDLVGAQNGGGIDSFDFPLEANPDANGPSAAADVRLLLDHAAVERKLRAAREYPELAAEVERALAAHGEAAFAIERLRLAADRRPIAERVGEPPLYERYGEQRVGVGRYAVVLRLVGHFLPFAAALEREVRGRPSCASS